MPRAEINKRIAEVAEIIGLTPLLDRKPRQLSGGQRQRVAVGAALCRQSGVLLFDEPLSNLDAKLRVHMRVELKRLHQQIKSTMVYVTHDQIEAMTMGDRIVIMNGGKICQVGSAMDVYERPATRFVAGFIGTPPMNFFEGELSQGGIALAGGLQLALPRAAEPGRKVVLGVRPEHIALRAGKEHAAKVPATVEVLEPLGNRTIVTARSPAGVLQLEAEANPGLKPGDAIELWFDMSTRAPLRPGQRMRPVAVRLPFWERETPFGTMLVVPAVLYLTAFIAYPFAMSIWLSLTDAQAGASKWNYIGLDNYSKVESWELTANDFVLFDGDAAEAQRLAGEHKDGKVVTAPDGARFKASLQVGTRTIPVVVANSEDDATYLATTILNDLDWQVQGGKVIAHAGDSALSMGSFDKRAAAVAAEKTSVLVDAHTRLKANGTGVQQDPNFMLAVKNTLKYTFGTELVKLFFGIPCALLLYRKFRGRQLLRGLLVIPWVIPIAISGQAWLWILDSTYSVINWLLVHWHILTPQTILNFRGDAHLAMFSLIVVNVWRGFPFTTIVILAGLTAIPDEIIERARLDGANALQRFWYVMAPMVRPILMVSLLFSVVFSFTDFNTIWIITRGGPYDQTQVLTTYAYQVGVNAGYLGKGAAISLFLFPIMVVTVFGMLQWLRRENM